MCKLWILKFECFCCSRIFGENPFPMVTELTVFDECAIMPNTKSKEKKKTIRSKVLANNKFYMWVNAYGFGAFGSLPKNTYQLTQPSFL
mmetsp:Transcript_3507/g.5421  ORF Transcript_3507/g.5421 Transcript_3507/m.5421 type:complete len:89 (+) Transcript_3507:272-538(+)